MFFLAALNFLKSAFEHNTVEDLVPTAGKNIYAWGKVFLRDTFLVLFVILFEQGKNIWPNFV